MHLYIFMYNLLLNMLDMIRGRGRLSPGACLWVLLIVGACHRNSFLWGINMWEVRYRVSGER
jgi:hypothetical protein